MCIRVRLVFCLFASVACALGTLSAQSAWERVLLSNASLRNNPARHTARGDPTLTGDGCQWPRAVAVDGTDGRFMLWRTDVGGLFRSIDGGRNWEPANVGFGARAAWSSSTIRAQSVLVPTNARESPVAFHPTDPQVILSTGGDYPPCPPTAAATTAWPAMA